MDRTGLTVHRPEMALVDVTRLLERPCALDELRVALPAPKHGLQEAVRAVWQLTSENTGESDD
jgi:hypothetical protein